jgi:hypothetical protein
LVISEGSPVTHVLPDTIRPARPSGAGARP